MDFPAFLYPVISALESECFTSAFRAIPPIQHYRIMQEIENDDRKLKYGLVLGLY